MSAEVSVEAVRQEVEALHEFFVGWFGGSLTADVFEGQFVDRFAGDLVFIPPAGHLLGLEDLAGSVRNGHDSNPDFRVQIRNVQIHRRFDDHVLATYEEWQRNALASTPPNNARLATVLFRVEEQRLRWLHIHETWLPEALMAAGPYDF